jgi:hypothetical protein
MLMVINRWLRLRLGGHQQRSDDGPPTGCYSHDEER